MKPRDSQIVLASLALSALLLLGPSIITEIGAVSGATSTPTPAQFRTAGSGPNADAVTVSYNGIDPTAISLSWSRSTDVYNYNYTIQESSSSNGPWTTVKVINVTDTTSEAVTGISPATTYYFRVWDCGLLVGCTPSANTLEVTTPTTATLTYTLASESSVSLSWSNSATYGGWVGFTSYVIDESINGGSYSALTTVTSESTQSNIVNGLSLATHYSFLVKTTDNVSQSSDSNAVNFTTPSPLTAAASAQPATVNIGQSTTLACIPTGGVGPYTYSWSFGDSTTGTGATTTHSYSSAGTFTATCTVTDHYGLVATSSTTVTVNANPTVAGLPANEGYALIGAIIVVVIIVAIVATVLTMRSRKKRREAPQPYTPTAPPQQGQAPPSNP
jgi:chitodextrinase